MPVDHVKHLGMYLDKYLSWNHHFFQLSNKLSRANGILSKLRHYAPFETVLQVYYAIFYSHLTYGCNVWGLTSTLPMVVMFGALLHILPMVVMFGALLPPYLWL